MSKKGNNGKIEELLKTDFSSEDDSKEKILKQLLLKLDEKKYIEEKKESLTMKKIFVRPILAAAVIAVSAVGFAMTSYGQEFYRVIREVLVGEHAKYIVMERTSTSDLSIPEELEGKLYDRDGNVLESFPQDGEIYNEKGEALRIHVKVSGDDTIVEALTEEEHMERESRRMTIVSDPQEAKPYLAFDFSLPGYLPEGYAFDRIQLYNDENGKPVENCEYADVYFSNGDRSQDIFLQLRLMNEKTAYESGELVDIEEIEINGNKGVMRDGSLDVEIDGVMYNFRAGTAEIGSEELIKMAESIAF